MYHIKRNFFLWRIDERDGIVDCIAKDSSPLDTDQIFGTGFQRVPGIVYFSSFIYLVVQLLYVKHLET